MHFPSAGKDRVTELKHDQISVSQIRNEYKKKIARCGIKISPWMDQNVLMKITTPEFFFLFKTFMVSLLVTWLCYDELHL